MLSDLGPLHVGGHAGVDHEVRDHDNNQDHHNNLDLILTVDKDNSYEHSIMH